MKCLMRKTKLLLMIAILISIQIAYALFNPDGSCIVNTPCTFTLNYVDDNGTQRVDAVCVITTYDPYGNNLMNQTPMTPNTSTLDYSITITPNSTGLYTIMVYCDLIGNQPVIGDLSFVADIPINETPSYIIARETVNQTSFLGQIANLFQRWIMWLGIPLYPEINIKTTIDGPFYKGNIIKFNSKVTNEFNKIITNATCILITDMMGNHSMTYNIVTKRYQAQIIPNSTGSLKWNVTCTV